SYTASHVDGYIADYGSGTSGYQGQSFLNANSCILDGVVFWGQKNNSPTGNVCVKIYAHTGIYGSNGVPSGTALATSDVRDASTMPANVGLMHFLFSGTNRITLSASTNYCAILVYTSGDVSNFISLGYDMSSPLHGGNFIYGNGSSWTSYSGYDCAFWVFSQSYVDNYPESFYTTPVVNYGLANPSVGQTFACWVDKQLDSVKLYLSVLNSPVGNCYVEIYAHAGSWGTTGIPTGPPLAISDALNVASVGTSMGLITYTFSGANRIALSAGTKYVMVHHYGGTVSANWVKFGVDTAQKLHYGNMVWSSDGITWSPDTSYDAIFYVIGVLGGGGSAQGFMTTNKGFWGA
ncbi:MAG: hypothetical protein WCL00_14885, partial [Bacteroidota bacterium]